VKFQAPSTKSQINPNDQNPNFQNGLAVSVTWTLEFGAYLELDA